MNIAMVAADLTKWVAYGRCKVVRLFGYNAHATDDRYIQLFQTPTVAASDIPAVKSLWAPASAAFSWELDIELSELLVAISTTEPNYTAVGAGTGLDMTIVVETDFPVTPSVTLISGDLTTGVANKQVWTSANGYKKLLRLDVTNNSADKAWAILQASDIAATIDRKSAIFGCPVSTTKTFFFGKDGHIPFYQEAGIVHKGLTVRMATGDANGFVTLPYSFSAATDFNIRAIYEDI